MNSEFNDIAMLINAALALSNFIALGYINTLAPIDAFIVASAVLASFLMHLSETKHGLNGIYPFNQYSWAFLQIDRAIAVIAGLYLIYRCNPNYWLCACSAFGLINMYLAEKIEPFRSLIHNQLWFFTFHMIWHFTAYYIMWLVLA